MTAPVASLREATVAIVGLGLMGGSLGLALAGSCARRIGVDLGPGAADAAVTMGAVDEHASLAEAAAHADIVVLAVPVVRSIELAADTATAMRAGSVLTDVGSTKAAVCAAFDALGARGRPGHLGAKDGPLRSVAAIGGHPMCGRELSGIEHADRDLFRGATWALADTAATTEHARRIIGELVAATGARAISVDRHVHDRAVAAASHLPYVVAQALVGALASADAHTDGAATQLAATGFAGATRLANGDVDMWRDVLVTNVDNVREAIDGLQHQLTQLAGALDDPRQLEQLLRTGRDIAARRAR